MLVAALRDVFNQMNGISRANRLGNLLSNTKSVVHGTYDFSKQGGKVGDISLLDDDGLPLTLPAGFIVMSTVVHVATAVTSGGSATVALKAASAGDLLAATAKTSFTSHALIQGVEDGTVTNGLRMSAAHVVKATVAVAALTAGKLDVYLEGYQS